MRICKILITSTIMRFGSPWGYAKKHKQNVQICGLVGGIFFNPAFCILRIFNPFF